MMSLKRRDQIHVLTKYTSSIFRSLAKEPGWTQTEIMLWQEIFLIINQTKVRFT